MFAMKRLLGGCVFVSTLFTTTAFAQEVRAPNGSEREPSAAVAPLVTAAATATRVRFVSPGTVVQLRLEVYSEAGQKLFDTELHGGNVMDWYLQDGAGQRLSAGAYACVLTIKSLSGRLSQRVGMVTVSEEKVALAPVEVAQLSMAQQQTIGPIEANVGFTVGGPGKAEAITAVTHDGSDGQMSRTQGALSFRLGDFFGANDQEQMRLTEEGNLGIGTAKPQAKLDVAGAIRTTKGIEFSDGTVQNTGLSGRKDANGALVPTVVGTGTQNRQAKWIDNSGTLGDSLLSEAGGNVVNNGTNIQMTAAPSSNVDTNLIFVNANDRTTGMIASSAPAFAAGNGPYFAMRGNNYSSLPGQRGLFSLSTGSVASPTGNDGSMVFLTGADQVRMMIRPGGNVGIGNNNPLAKLHVAGNIDSTQYDINGQRVLSVQQQLNTFVGVNSGTSNTIDPEGGAGAGNSFFGYRSGNLNTQGGANSFFGYEAGANNALGLANSFFGSGTGRVSTGTFNSFFGNAAGVNNTQGHSNSFFGYLAGESNTIEQNNTFIGTLSNGAPGITNATALGYSAKVTQSNSLVLGGVTGQGGGSNTNVGIGTTAPAYKLHIIDASNIGIRVETSQAGGRVASFAANGDFQIDAVNVPGGRFAVMEGGNVGINTATPGAKLQVVGGDVAITTPSRGLILKAADGAGSCYRLTVTNAGVLNTTFVPCP